MPVLLKKNFPASIENIEIEVRKRLQNNETHSFIYVAPTRRKVRELQREFVRLTPNKIAPAFFLYTLETLAAQIHSLLCPPRRIISGPVQVVLMNEAIRRSEQLLQYFRLRGGSKKLPPGTLKRIIDVINNLKQKGVYRSALMTEVEYAEKLERPKLNDILSIYDNYERLLGDQFIDTAGLFQQINSTWDKSVTPALVRNYFSSVNTIFVSGFDEFSDPELSLLYNLSTVDDIGIVVSFDYHLENDNVFGHLRENYEKLLNMGFRKITTHLETDKSFVNHITKYLCNPGKNDIRFNANRFVSLLAVEDRLTEVELIAKIVKGLTKENPGHDLSRICVAMFQPQVYTNLFREVFERYGIPVNITDRYYLDQSPLIVSIISLLTIPQHNYRLTDIMRALSSPYLRIMNDQEIVDASNLYEIAILLKISSGYDRWITRIEHRIKQIPGEIDEFDDPVEAKRLLYETEMLEKAKSDIECLKNVLHRFDGEMSPGEFKENLLNLMDELRVAECILQGAVSLNDNEKLEKDTRAYQKFLSFIDDFLEILQFEGKNNVRERLPYYVERLRDAVSQVRYNIRQKYGYGVSITSIDETRGLHFDVMIIAGMIDGEFPPIYQPKIFFSSTRRAQKERYHLHEHRYLFYQALTNFTEHLYLTYPKSDSDIELVPSSFLNDLLKIVELEDCREDIPVKYSGTIYSQDDFIRFIGKNTDRLSECSKNVLSRHQELKKVFDHMCRAAAIERDRMEKRSLAEYNGIIGEKVDENGKASLERIRQHVFSVTQLETYGKCPFQYFANRILRLNVFEEVEEGVTPIERGGILHEILFEFYVKRRERSLPPLSQSTDEQFNQALEELMNIAANKFDQMQVSDVFWDVEKESLIGSKNRKGILKEFLEIERQNQFCVQPSLFEASFGTRTGSKRKSDPSLSFDKPIRAGNVFLRGKIDRIDRGENLFRIIDYKTGFIAGRSEIDLGISLQLPLYLYAVEHILAEHVGERQKGVAGIYYELKTPVKERVGLASAEHEGETFSLKRKTNQIVETDEELSRVINQAIKFINDYVDKIVNGFFPVEPKTPEKTCLYCDYLTICRIQLNPSAQPIVEGGAESEEK